MTTVADLRGDIRDLLELVRDLQREQLASRREVASLSERFAAHHGRAEAEAAEHQRSIERAHEDWRELGHRFAKLVDDVERFHELSRATREVATEERHRLSTDLATLRSQVSGLIEDVAALRGHVDDLRMRPVRAAVALATAGLGGAVSVEGLRLVLANLWPDVGSG